jgi:hypothetical protein
VLILPVPVNLIQIMKTFPLFIAVLLAATACQAQPSPVPPGLPQRLSPATPAGDIKQPVNYTIRVEWKAPKEDAKTLQILTADGSFELDTIQKTSVKINDADIPVTLKFSGTLTALDDEKGQLRLFLGRTVPYITGSSSGPGSHSTYSQLSVGLNSTFVVKFGQSQVIQSDENGDITVLVKRVEK